MNTSRSNRVLLFSGHMIDAPNRESPRFPPELEPAVAKAIHDEIDALDTSASDIAISSGACGSDILFAEDVLARGIALRMHLPFSEAEFIDKSVSFADADWTGRFANVASRAQRFIATEIPGDTSAGEDPYERTNMRMLDEALSLGGNDVVLICVWNGQGGDGPGGTKHMVETVRAKGGEVRWIDIRRL
ncbi:hypothetical protein [Paraburkholderia azotifigens]|uniref:DUF1273 family protein n=1 Tax=Paraburkholderia azotifigens TaxID=2057004 RepID=A0A5C6V6R1_9BURK|nr:hypothetical protein [Paraburkholderia azotifigens]TXC80156.1 hypothetical protein FRZ40_38290 [Paraburkholderia azotifigens]